MKTQYGEEIVYLVQPTKVDYSLYNSDPIKGIMEYTYRTYYLATIDGYNSSISIQLNRINAQRFCIVNGLKLVKDTEIEKFLAPRPRWYRRPEIKLEKLNSTKSE